jgi:formylglycine-generating enzyme required for sulfatase activity
VLRGGSWDDDDDFLFTTSRLEDVPTRRADRFGFRCVFELPEK